MPQAPSGFALGAAHVAGTYPALPVGDSFLVSGAERLHALGATTIKVYLTPDYAAKYNEDWPSGISTLTELAQSAPFQALLSMPFSTFVLTTYTFANGTGDAWRAGVPASLLAAEQDEMQALTTYLLKKYAGTGKHFVLQNWEGDWALLDGNDPTAAIPAGRADNMRAWFEARQAGVTQARDAIGEHGVTVRHAVEVNRVLDANGRTRVINSVLPGLHTDAVSYSAWEATLIPSGADESSAEQAIGSSLGQALDLIKAAAPAGAEIYLGEFGFAENETNIDVSKLIGVVATTARAKGTSRAIYWQLYDNECQGPGVDCRGLWLVKPDQSLSSAGVALQSLLASAT